MILLFSYQQKLPSSQLVQLGMLSGPFLLKFHGHLLFGLKMQSQSIALFIGWLNMIDFPQNKGSQSLPTRLIFHVSSVMLQRLEIIYSFFSLFISRLE